MAALATQSSGVAEPTTTYANMIWYETDTNWLWQRNEADSAWVRLLYVDQSGSLSLLDETKVVNAAGVQQGLLGDQTTGTWETGTSTTESLVSPAKVKAAVGALASSGLAFLASIDVSNQGTADFTEFDATKYDSYEFVFANVIPSNDREELLMRTSTDGGASYDSSGYAWINTRTVNSTAAISNGASSSAMQICNEIGSASNEDGVSGIVNLFGPHLTKRTMITAKTVGFSGTANSILATEAVGSRFSSADVDAVRFLFTSGNLESGTITMYGKNNA